MKTAQWIIRVIKSCKKLTQLNNTLVLIENYRKLHREKRTINKEIDILYESFQNQEQFIIKEL